METLKCRACGAPLRAQIIYQDVEDVPVEPDGNIYPTHCGEPKSLICSPYCTGDPVHIGRFTGHYCTLTDDGWKCVPLSDEDYAEFLAQQEMFERPADDHDM